MTFKPSKQMIQNVLDTLSDRDIKEEEEETYTKIVVMCETYIGKNQVQDLQPDTEKFVEEVEEIIKEWYTSCPKAIQFVTKVVKSYRKNIGDINIEENKK